MIGVTKWASLAAVIASFCLGLALANAQQTYAPAAFVFQPPLVAPQPMVASYPVIPVAYQPELLPPGSEITMLLPPENMAAMLPPGSMPGQPMMMPVMAPPVMAPPAMPAALLQPPAIPASPEQEAPGKCHNGCAGCRKAKQCGCGPMWYVRASWLALARDLGQAPMVTYTETGDMILGSNRFDSDYESGIEISLRRRLHALPKCSLEVSYFQIDGFRKAFDYTTTGMESVSYFVNEEPGIDVEQPYASDLRNVEVNLILGENHALFSLIGGFRFLQLDESANDLDTEGISIGASTENELYGFQLGGELLLLHSPILTVTSLGKAGVFSAGSRSLWVDPINGADGFRDEESDVAYAAELAMRGILHVTGHLHFECGYRLLWLGGVVLAGEQYSTTVETGTTINRGDVLFHGFDVGIAGTW
jgi:hypothetical protein